MTPATVHVIRLTPDECQNAGAKIPHDAKEEDVFILAEERRDGLIGSVVLAAFARDKAHPLVIGQPKLAIMTGPLIQALGALVVSLSDRVTRLERAQLGTMPDVEDKPS